MEELLVHGAVVDAGTIGPFPGILAAVASRAHPAVVLWWGQQLFDEEIYMRLTDVEATPSHPLGALVESQVPTVAACDPPPPGELSPLPTVVGVDTAAVVVDGAATAAEVAPPDILSVEGSVLLAESSGC